MTVRDETGQETSERAGALPRSGDAEKYEFLVEATQTAYVILDDRGRVLDANAEYVRLTGRSSLDELLGRPVTEWTAPHDLERNAAEVAKCMSNGSVHGLVIDYAQPSGATVPVEIHAAVLPGPPPRIFTVLRDLTERRRADEALRASEARMRSVVDSSPVGMHLYRLEPDGRLVFTGANPAADRILGVENAAFVGKAIEEAFPPLAATEVPRRYREVVETGLPWNTEQVDYADGAIRGAFEVHAFRTGPDSMVAAFEDITERKRTEQALQESEARFRELAESLPLSLFEADLQGRLTYANRAAFETFGYTREDFEAGLTVAQMIAPADRWRALQTTARRLRADRGGYREYLALRRDGNTFPVSIDSAPILRDGSPAGLRGIITDLTERRALEEERLKAQKLESVGTLAGGIAHDFNNVLQGVFGYASLIRMSLDRREEVLELLDHTERALHQAVHLTTQLLTFSKGGKPVRRVVDLRRVVEEAAALALSGSRILFDLQAERGLSHVEADEGQIGQVVRNVVLNAEQAMPSGGRIEIALRNAPWLSPPEGTAPPGGCVEIRITDHGVGIPKEHLARIFDPYFTTKKKGSGLGLATCYSIVKNHDGEIAVTSVPGSGTTFTIRLPATDAAPAPDAGRRAPADVRKGRILLMDDERSVRDVARKLLERLGHEAEFAERGDEAVAKYRAALDAGSPFDLVILDLTIRAGMGGIETLQELRRIDPKVRAIISSGYSEKVGETDFANQGFSGFLSKPYGMKELVEALDRALST